VREGPAAAAEELDRGESESETFGQVARRIDCDEMARDMATAGLDVVARYGGRCANDLLADDDAKHDAEYFSELERLELALCDREPFKRMGQFWQLVGERRSP
jgi:S-adenosylmethionine-dependent methyltransferase